MVGETTTTAAVDSGILRNSFRAVALELSTTYSGAPRAKSWPKGDVAVGATFFAVSANTVVTGREENGDAARTSLHKVVADTVHVAAAEVALLSTVGSRNGGRGVGGRV